MPAPGAGVGWWAGSSSAALDEDGTFVVAYRVRPGEKGRGSTVVSRSVDGERFEQVGNAAGLGVRRMLASRRARARAAELGSSARYVELSSRTDFQRRFLQQIGFPRLAGDAR